MATSQVIWISVLLYPQTLPHEHYKVQKPCGLPFNEAMHILIYILLRGL